MNDDQTCREPAGWDGWRTHPCGNRGKVEKDGKRYCGVHDPDKVAAKAQARREKYEASLDASRRSAALAAAKDAVCEAAKVYATAFENKAVPEMTYLNAVHLASVALRAAVRALRELESR